MTTPPNPAAAAVERIVRECACSQHNQWADDHSNNGTYTLGLNEDETKRFFADMKAHIHRAIADAIAATGAREKLEAALACLEALEPTVILQERKKTPNFNEHAERENQLSAARVTLDQALANLDAVCGKEMK